VTLLGKAALDHDPYLSGGTKDLEAAKPPLLETHWAAIDETGRTAWPYSGLPKFPR